jgi:hypothetical protein
MAVTSTHQAVIKKRGLAKYLTRTQNHKQCKVIYDRLTTTFYLGNGLWCETLKTDSALHGGKLLLPVFSPFFCNLGAFVSIAHEEVQLNLEQSGVVEADAPPWKTSLDTLPGAGVGAQHLQVCCVDRETANFLMALDYLQGRNYLAFKIYGVNNLRPLDAAAMAPDNDVEEQSEVSLSTASESTPDRPLTKADFVARFFGDDEADIKQTVLSSESVAALPVKQVLLWGTAYCPAAMAIKLNSACPPVALDELAKDINEVISRCAQASNDDAWSTGFLYESMKDLSPQISPQMRTAFHMFRFVKKLIDYHADICREECKAYVKAMLGHMAAHPQPKPKSQTQASPEARKQRNKRPNVK